MKLIYQSCPILRHLGGKILKPRKRSSEYWVYFIFHDAKRTSLVVKYTSHDVKHKIPRAVETFSPSVCRFSLGGLWHFFGVSARFLWRSCNISFEFLGHFFGAPAAFFLTSLNFSSEWNLPKNLVLRLFFRKFAVKNSGYAKTQDVLCGPDAFGPPKWQKSILWKEKFQFHTIKGARSTLFKAEWENCSG